MATYFSFNQRHLEELFNQQQFPSGFTWNEMNREWLTGWDPGRAKQSNSSRNQALSQVGTCHWEFHLVGPDKIALDGNTESSPLQRALECRVGLQPPLTGAKVDASAATLGPPLYFWGPPWAKSGHTGLDDTCPIIIKVEVSPASMDSSSDVEQEWWMDGYREELNM